MWFLILLLWSKSCHSLGVDTFSSCQCLFALFHAVFSTIISVCFPFEPWLCPHPEALIRNSSSIKAPVPLPWPSDAVSFLAGNNLCCQSVFMKWLAGVLSSWPTFPQDDKIILFGKLFRFSSNGLQSSLAALLGGVRTGEHSNALRSCQQEWISWDPETSTPHSSSRRERVKNGKE